MTRIAVLMAVAVLLGACAGGLLNKGDAPYLDANGDVVKAYAAERLAVVDAAIRTLPAIQAAMVARNDNHLETILAARAPDGSDLRLRFVEEGRGLTVVRVRTGRIGYPNLEYSQQFHTYLAAKLNPDEHPQQSSALEVSPPPPPIAESMPEAGDKTTEVDLMAATPPTRREAPPRPEPPTPGPAPAVPPQSVPEPETEKAPQEPEAEITAALPPARHEALPPQPPTPDPPPADASRTIPEPETEEATQAPEADPAAAVPPARPESPSSPQPDYVVTFEKDSNIPSSAALEILNEAANRLQDNPDTFAELSGHADADEDPEAQNLVSESRALAVKSYLIGRGISAGRIRATWHGSDRPASEPDNPVQQRRVEIRLFRGL